MWKEREQTHGKHGDAHARALDGLLEQARFSRDPGGIATLALHFFERIFRLVDEGKHQCELAEANHLHAMSFDHEPAARKFGRAHGQ